MLEQSRNTIEEYKIIIALPDQQFLSPNELFNRVVLLFFPPLFFFFHKSCLSLL